MTGSDDVVRSRTSRVPLRITLVALLVVLVALALVATGAGATAMLRGYLVAQQDDELRTVLRQAEGNRRIVAACPLDPGSDLELDPEDLREFRIDDFIGVEEQNPVVPGCLDAALPLRHEAEPSLLDDVRTEGVGDRLRSIRAAGVNDDAVVSPSHAGEAAPDVTRLILG